MGAKLSVYSLLNHFIKNFSSTFCLFHSLGFHLLPPYLFYFHGLLLNPLGFLGPITTYLPLITFWAYWPLGRLIQFTNSFLGLPRPIYLFLFPWAYYFIHWASSTHLLLLYIFSFLWASQPSILSFQSIWLVSLFPYNFPFLTFSILLRFFCYWTFCQKWASTK